MFHNVSEAVLCDRRNTLASLSEDELHFSQQAQHFGDLHRHFAWQAQRRVAASRCVCFFCESHCQGCGKWWQRANSVAGLPFVRCDENSRKSHTKHWFWASKFWGSWENSEENVDFVAAKCENLRKSCPKCSFWDFWDNMSRLDSLVFFCRPCAYGGSKNLLFFEGFKPGCNNVLRGRRGTLWHSNMFHNMSKIYFLVRQAQYSCIVVRRWVAFFAAGAALWRPPSSFCVAGAETCRGSALRVFFFGESHCQGCVKWWQCANRVASVGHRESVILRGRGSISDTLHSLHSIHFTLHTLQLTLYTPHPTYTLHFTHPTFTLHTLHFTLHTSGFEFGERGRARLLTHIRL